MYLALASPLLLFGLLLGMPRFERFMLGSDAGTERWRYPQVTGRTTHATEPGWDGAPLVVVSPEDHPC